MPENNDHRQVDAAEGAADVALLQPHAYLRLGRSPELSEEENACHEALASAVDVTAYGAKGVEAEGGIEATNLRQTLKDGLSEGGRARLLGDIPDHEAFIKRSSAETLHLRHRQLGDVYCGLGTAFGSEWFDRAFYWYGLALNGEKDRARQGVLHNNVAATKSWHERWRIAGGQRPDSDLSEDVLCGYEDALTCHEFGGIAWGQSIFNLAREYSWMAARTGKREWKSEAVGYLDQLQEALLDRPG